MVHKEDYLVDSVEGSVGVLVGFSVGFTVASLVVLLLVGPVVVLVLVAVIGSVILDYSIVSVSTSISNDVDCYSSVCQWEQSLWGNKDL